MKNLVIVESPAKAKTIEKYLGRDFHVLSSVGHIRSIVKKTKDGTPPIDVANDFFAVYEVDPEKKKVITELKKNVKAVGKDNVWLATDEDREGEAIAWHLCKVLDLPIETTKRIVFHEITKDAITNAIKNPRTVDMNLVQAQQARQILDRLVGFELSPVVWQKVPGGKSAGRVQSPAVRLLVEREREIMKFAGSSQFKVTAIFIHDNQEFKAELNQKFDSEAAAHKFLNSLKPATFTVSDISKTPGTRNPAAPFTTSTLQQEANAKLGFSSKATMASAQRLYQDGKITYMRTDSVNLSGQAIASATDFIKRLYGPDYSTVRKFKTKSASAQEAHEAIRPTDITRETVTSNEYDQKLYDLIRRRTLASQMSPAKLEKTTVVISIEKALVSPSSSRVHSSLASPPEMARERSAETSAPRERFTASVGGGDASAESSLSDPSSLTDSSELLRLTHLTIKKVTRDIEDEKFNTAVAAMMEMVNSLYKFKESHGMQASETWRFTLESLLQILAPFAPHITEELWQELGHADTIHVNHWPKWDEKYLVSDVITIIVQVNGKLRAKLELPADTDKDAIEQAALADENVIKFTSNKPPKKVIYVPKKLVNIVI